MKIADGLKCLIAWNTLRGYCLCISEVIFLLGWDYRSWVQTTTLAVWGMVHIFGFGSATEHIGRICVAFLQIQDFTHSKLWTNLWSSHLAGREGVSWVERGLKVTLPGPSPNSLVAAPHWLPDVELNPWVDRLELFYVYTGALQA